MEIRRAIDGDLTDLAQLERLSFSEPWSPASLAQELGRPDNLILVTGELSTAPGIDAYVIHRLVGSDAELLRLAVLPDSRRKGLGSSLLSHSFSGLAARGAIRCLLEVRADNQAAIGLYRRFSPRLLSTRAGYYRDGCDALILSIDIDPEVVTGHS